MRKKRTVTLDGNPKLFSFVEDIVEILRVQLGPKEGVPVHCSESGKVLRGYNTKLKRTHFPALRG